MRAASDVTLRPVRSSVDATRSERSPAGFIFSQSIRTSNGKEKKEAMLPSGWSFFFLSQSLSFPVSSSTFASQWAPGFSLQWKPEDATTHECFSFCYLAEMWPTAWKGNEELNQAISLLHFLQISVRRRQRNVSVYRIKGRQVQFVIYTSTFGSVCAPSLASPTENCPHTFINYFSWPTYPVQGRWGGLESVPAHVVLL